MSLKEFNEMPVWLTDALEELLDEARDATITALKGRKPLDKVGGIPRSKEE